MCLREQDEDQQNATDQRHAVERAFDGMTLVGSILLVFILFPRAHLLGGAALVTGIAFLGLAAGILFYVLADDKTHGAVDRLLGFLPGSLRKPIDARLGFFLWGIRGISTTGELLAA